MEMNVVSDGGWGYMALSVVVVYVLTYTTSSNKSAGAQCGVSIVPIICGLLAGASGILAIGVLVLFGGLGAFIHICILVYVFKHFGHYLHEENSI